MEFKCTECNYPGEDNTLHLMVKESTTQEFIIKPNGSLEHYDSDGDGQEIYLRCPVCGQKYEFTKDQNEFALQLEEVHALKKYIYGRKIYSNQYLDVELEDLTYQKVDD